MTEEKSVGRDAPTLVAQLKKSLYCLEVQDSLENADVVEYPLETIRSGTPTYPKMRGVVVGDSLGIRARLD